MIEKNNFNKVSKIKNKCQSLCWEKYAKLKTVLRARWWWHMPLIPVLGRQRKQISVSVRPDWSTRASSRIGSKIYRKTLSQNPPNQQKTKKTKQNKKQNKKNSTRVGERETKRTWWLGTQSLKRWGDYWWGGHPTNYEPLALLNLMLVSFLGPQILVSIFHRN